jgi:hypothetical protein
MNDSNARKRLRVQQALCDPSMQHLSSRAIATCLSNFFSVLKKSSRNPQEIFKLLCFRRCTILL